MRRDPIPRSQRPDVFVRPPCRDGDGQSWAAMFDPAASLVELADLFARGLITRRELERQMAKVFAPLELSATRLLGREDSTVEVTSQEPYAAFESIDRNNRLVLMLGSWATAAALRPYAEPPPPPRRASRRPACDRSSSGGT